MNSKKPRKGEATEEDIKKASQLEGLVIPIKPVVKRQRAMELTDDIKNFKVIARHNFPRFFEKEFDKFCRLYNCCNFTIFFSNCYTISRDF